MFFCDHGNLRRSAQRAQEELGMMLDSLLQSGLLCGELCDFSADWEQLCHELLNESQDYKGDIEELFEAELYLISPLTEAARFLNKEYFLTSRSTRKTTMPPLCCAATAAAARSSPSSCGRSIFPPSSPFR